MKLGARCAQPRIRVGTRVAILLSLTLLAVGCTHSSLAPVDAGSWSALERAYPGAFLQRVDTDRRVVALTFDDGPSELSGELLDLLAEHQVKATFFWQGNNLARYPELVRRAIDEGHTVGQHSWDHPHVAETAPEILWSEQLGPTNDEFLRVAGHRVYYYRPPFGETNSAQLSLISSHGIRTIVWSITSLDWDERRNSSDQIVERVISQLHPGAIILMHDYPRDDGGQAVLAAVEEIIETGKDQGYGWVSIDELVGSQ